MKASPLAQVKDRFGSKDKLIEAVQELATEELWIDRVDEDKGLERVSNKKLLHLHAVLSEVKAQFGSRQALIDAICELEKRGKDEGFRARLARWSTPRLLDAHRAAKKRS
jgi:AcrR family transcriptional regulator